MTDGSAPLRHRAARLAVGTPLLLAGCTAFATVRSAEVRPGPSLALHASAGTPPGDEAAWFWSLDCAERCDHPVVGGDVGLTYGWQPDRGPRGVAVGAGVSGLYPYVDGYVQMASGRSPWGVGARAGLPLTSWREHQVYGRLDVPLGAGARLLLNPALFVHEGRAPNGESPGSFVGFVQGVGLELAGERVTWTPALAVVAGRAERNSYGRQYGPARSVFGTASLGVTFHGRRAAGR